MPYCNRCDKAFATTNGYYQHLDTSAAHNSADWECSICDRCFVSEHARTQHYVNGEHPVCFLYFYIYLRRFASDLHSPIHTIVTFEDIDANRRIVLQVL